MVILRTRSFAHPLIFPRFESTPDAVVYLLAACVADLLIDNKVFPNIVNPEIIFKINISDVSRFPLSVNRVPFLIEIVIFVVVYEVDVAIGH